jgi:CheY-like chemotaxis protein
LAGACSVVLVVVERDKHVQAFLRDFLSKYDCELVFVDDGETALEIVKTRRPALVITEVLLPKLDGLGLCRAIKFTPATSDIPVVVLTVLEARQRAALAGADAYFVKPLEERQLIEGLRPYLSSLLPSPGADR